jgi:ADP-ribose pyrophosphatase YjhB (NUDIX family)
MAEFVARPGVGAVVRDGVGRVLLHRRRVGCGWAPPSGGVEAGESLTAALARELAEETQLAVTIDRLAGVYSDPRFQVVDYGAGRRVHYVTCVFLCDVAGGELVGSSEGEQWGWFARDALPEPMLDYARVWLTDALAPDPAMVLR